MDDDKLKLAKSLQIRGRAAEAEALYREILRDAPHTAPALEGLGVLIFQQGRAAEAADLFARGVAVCPESARFHANLGEALRSTGRTDEALTHLRRASDLDPKLPHAWNSLCSWPILTVDLQSPRLTAARRSGSRQGSPRPTSTSETPSRRSDVPPMRPPALRLGLAIEPHNSLTLMNLALALCELNEPAALSEAEELASRAVTLAPQIPTAHRILGNILKLAGRHDEARASFARAGDGNSPTSSADPHAVATARRATPAPHVLGMAHLQQGRLDQAEASFREAQPRPEAGRSVDRHREHSRRARRLRSEQPRMPGGHRSRSQPGRSLLAPCNLSQGPSERS